MNTSAHAGSLVDQRFLLSDERKRGGMGTVWKARDLISDRTVALKILHEIGPEQSERFAREGALLANLSHPGVVAYVAHGTTADGVPYLAMEWLDGENLADRLAGRPLTLLDSLAVLRGAARGLAAAHRRGILHRDLKPSNLFLRGARVDDVVLLDLGIARHVQSDTGLTRAGTILGTPGYMAPEQAQGQRGLGARVDVFSLGCVLYECLTGDPPFVGAHVLTVLAKVLFEEAPRLRDVRPELPAVVGDLVEAMLAKDPARRPADAATLGAALEALGELPDVPAARAAPGAARPAARTPAGSEQELVSVILATPGRGGGGDAAAAGLPDPLLPQRDTERQSAALELPDVAVYGGVLKQLADGTTVITLGQRGGAATDLATRAARCALRLQAGRPEWRFVLATGRGIPRERSYIGEAVDRAGVMLRDHAPASGGAILLDEITAGLLDGRFRTARTPGGAAFVLEGEDPSIDPARRLLGRPTACVGRDHELGMLELALRSCVADDSPRAVLVVGPPGIGKSRLRHEFLRHVQAPRRDDRGGGGDGGGAGGETVVLLGMGDPIRATGTRTLLGGAVTRLCGIRPEMSEDDKRAALERRIGRRLPADSDQRRTTVFMGELCGVRYPGDVLPELDAAQRNAKIMADLVAQAWLAFLRAEAAAGPVLLVLDDLQWSDQSSISLVGAALRELTSSPLMVLALGRPEVQELHPDLWAPRLATLPLAPLGPAATGRLVRQVLGPEVSDDSVNRMVRRAGGNALYLEELIRAAEARVDAVPETVLAMLQARIGLLPAPSRRVLRAASVFGEDFPLAGVEALLRWLGADEDLEPALAVLSRHEVLEQHAEPATAGDGSDGRAGGRWRFRHALMRDAAYLLLTADDAAMLHGLAARHLDGAGEDPAVVGAHCERAGDRTGAVRHYLAAAEQACRSNDLAAVLSLVKQSRACGASGQDWGMLRCVEAETRFFQNEFAASFEASAEALALLPPEHPKRISSLAWYTFVGMQLGKGGEIDAQMEELVAADPGAVDRGTYVLALGYATITHIVLGNRVPALRLLDRLAAVDALLGAADPLVHGYATYWQCRFVEMLGDDPHEAWRLAKEGAACHERSGDRRMLAFTQVEVGECARRLYSMDDGEAMMRRATKLAEELREPITTAFVMQYLANFLAEHGSAEQQPEAHQLARSVIELGGLGAYRVFGQVALGLVRLRLGELGGAEEVLREASATLRTVGLRALYPLVDIALIQVLLARRDVEGACQIADGAIRLLAEMGSMGLVEMPLRLWTARAHLAAGQRATAARGAGEAMARLEERAKKIPDPALRERFVSEVPEHVALAALARELGPGPR